MAELTESVMAAAKQQGLDLNAEFTPETYEQIKLIIDSLGTEVGCLPSFSEVNKKALTQRKVVQIGGGGNSPFIATVGNGISAAIRYIFSGCRRQRPAAMASSVESSGEPAESILTRLTGRAYSAAEVATLRILKLSDKSIDDAGAIALAEALPSCKELYELTLVRNNIGDAGAIALAAALPSVKGLVGLNLGDNHIGNEGAIAIAAALPSMKALQMLILNNNRIGRDGVRALVATKPSTLHITIEGNPISIRELGEIAGAPKAVINAAVAEHEAAERRSAANAERRRLREFAERQVEADERRAAWWAAYHGLPPVARHEVEARRPAAIEEVIRKILDEPHRIAREKAEAAEAARAAEAQRAAAGEEARRAAAEEARRAAGEAGRPPPAPGAPFVTSENREKIRQATAALGLSAAATFDDSKKAYRKLALKHHPDKGGKEENFKPLAIAIADLEELHKKGKFTGGHRRSQKRKHSNRSKPRRKTQKSN